jgi:tripartite-type tricarboxylate transporter receptor subunit TctC
MHKILGGLFATLCMLFGITCEAQVTSNFPTRNVRMVVPLTTGSGQISQVA